MSEDDSVTEDYRPDAEVVELCQELIRIDTSNFGSEPGPGERAAAERVAELLDEVGIACELLEPEPRRTSVVAQMGTRRRRHIAAATSGARALRCGAGPGG